MGRRSIAKLPSLCFSFSFFFIHFSLLIVAGENGGSDNNFPALAPLPGMKDKGGGGSGGGGGPLRPSIAVIVGILTTVFSLTFLLLLYAKHCRRSDTLNHFSTGGYPPVVIDRKNSGVDRGVIDTLPIFRFASLRGQKDGLECAVCLNRFESTEVLRLLPKCKHAFHVECVDTWLDAHSTCPLCRYRVDPEDILLVEDNRILYGETSTPRSSASQHPFPTSLDLRPAVSRVSGRHSFAGNSLEVIVETPKAAAVPRRSLDSWSYRKKKRTSNSGEMADVGCFDRPRKDELLLADSKTGKGKDVIADSQRRLEHRIIISGSDVETDGPHSQSHHRWSDVQPSDLLFLQSEMLLSDSCRRISGSRASRPLNSTRIGGDASTSSNNRNSISRSGKNWWPSSGSRSVVNGRSVSEITGLSRFRSNEDGDGDGEGEEEVDNNNDDDDEETRRRRKQGKRRKNWQQRRQDEDRKRQEGAVSRWIAWISQSRFNRQQQQPAVHEATTPSSSSSV